MRVTRPAAAIAIAAAGLAIVAAGTTGLLLTRQAAPAIRPPPRGVATVPAPATAIPGAASAAPAASATPQAGSARSASPASRRAGFQTVAPSVLADPVSLTIPLIGVRTSLITLGRAADGSMQVPASTMVAGWYTGSALPGAIGPAVIVGHVDSVTGPGVFFRLSQLRRGDRVYVTRADGTTAVFRVTSVRTYAKDVLPAKAVYGATPDPEVRLITCGGAFDDATGRYLSNVVVDATEAT
jgi:sortase (surface protein transpeptidase)